MIRYMLLALLLFPLGLYAQTPPCYSTFAVDKIEGCAPLTIRVISHVSNENPIYTYEPGITNSNTSHTYQTAGVYELVRIISPNCAGTVTDTLKITVYDNSPPTFTIDSCLNNIRLNITDNTYRFYQVWFQTATDLKQLSTVSQGTSLFIDDPLLVGLASYKVIVKGALVDQTTTCGENERVVSPLTNIPAGIPKSLLLTEAGIMKVVFDTDNNFRQILFEQINDGDWQMVTASVNADTFSLNNRNAQNRYCYRLGTISDCEDPTQITSPDQLLEGLSTTICSWPFSVMPENGFNHIQWEAHPLANAFEELSISRDGKTIALIQSSDSLDFQDSDIRCNTTYCYNIAIKLAGGETITMPSQCVKSLNEGKAIEANDLYASIEGDSLYVRWSLDTTNVSSLQLHRIVNGVSSQAEIALAQSYIDTDFSFKNDSTTCYFLEIQDSCGNSSLSDTTCYIRLVGEKNGEESLLWWNAFEGLNQHFSYIVEKQAAGNGNWEAVSQLLPFLDFYTYRELSANITARINHYRIKVVADNAPKIVAYSNTIRIEEPVGLLSPDAFTPNGDGLNDRFITLPLRLKEASLRIYNRLGIEVFAGNAGDLGWDGIHEGQPAATGAYVYVAVGEDVFGGKFSKKGTFLLLRP